MTTYFSRIFTACGLIVFATIATAATTTQASAVKVQDIPAQKVTTEFAVHPEVAAVPDHNAALGFSEDGEDFDMDVDSRELDTNEMNDEDYAGMSEDDDVDLDVGVHQLDTTKLSDTDVSPDEFAPTAVNADINDSERFLLLKKLLHKKKRFLHRRPKYRYGYNRHNRGYPYGRGYGYGGYRYRYGGRFGRFGRGRRFGPFGRFGRFGRFGPFGRGGYFRRFGRGGRFRGRYPYGLGKYGGYPYFVST